MEKWLQMRSSCYVTYTALFMFDSELFYNAHLNRSAIDKIPPLSPHFISRQHVSSVALIAVFNFAKLSPALNWSFQIKFSDIEMASWMSVWLFSLLAVIWLWKSQASYFRGGGIAWAPTGLNTGRNKVRFSFRLAFRRSTSSYYCDNNMIGSGSTLIGTGGTWKAKCSNPDNSQCSHSTSIANASFYCTDYSDVEDWSTGENTFNYTFTSVDEIWIVSFSSCCWMSLTHGSGKWLLSTTVNLTQRSDNGKINSSPVSRSLAFYRFQEGCPRSLRIPFEDPDGDVVKCRSASYSESFIHDGSFPYGVLNETTCVLRYDGANGTVGTYVVALTLEDFPAGTTDFRSVRPFSSVGLQFLVIINSRSGPCHEIPVFTETTPEDGECSEVEVGSAYRTVIEVQVADVSKQIVEIITSSPTKMELTSLRNRGGIYYRKVTWFPSSNQVGPQLFCFKAVDSSGLESEMRCTTILVGLSFTPRVILESRTPKHPVSRIGSAVVRWSIQFDRLIKRPRKSSYIRLVLLPSGHTVYKVDTLSEYVTIDSTSNWLHFLMPDAALSMTGSYAILIDKGAVVGQGCFNDGPPTSGISSTNEWSFSIIGVCAAGYYLGPPEFTTCTDVNECGDPSSTSFISQDDGCFHNPVGIEDSSIIPDGQMTASSSYDSTYAPSFGRLNNIGGRGGWCSRPSSSNNEWLQVDLGKSIRACGLATQGSAGNQYIEWTIAFKLLYSQDGQTWKTYLNGSGVEEEFYRKGERNIIDQHRLPVPVTGRYFRFNPTQRHSWNCLRVEIYEAFGNDTVTRLLDFRLHVPANCDHMCKNTPGSYSCSCISGYQLDSDGKSCVDINECSTKNGGCSHLCFNLPGSFYCGCPVGTTISQNYLTCHVPRRSVTCNTHNMTVSLEKQTYKFLEVKKLRLRYGSCRATQNSTHMILSTPLNGCGTLVNETADVLMFWNEIQVDAKSIDNDMISRTPSFKLPFYCSYPRKALLSLGFTPRKIYFGYEAGYGNFTFKMDFYKTSSFATPYTQRDYPLKVAVNEYVYLRYSVESSGDLVIMAENCKATKDGSFYSWPQYAFIQNGCSRDTTLDYSYDLTRSYQQFQLKTFTFFGDYDTVYLHCELIACHRYSSSSRCSKGCLTNAKRKKRDVKEEEHEESTTKVILTVGPLVIKDKPASKDPDQSNQTALIGGVAAVCGICLILIVAVVVLLKRRFTNHKDTGDFNTENKEMGVGNAYIQEDEMTEIKGNIF